MGGLYRWGCRCDSLADELVPLKLDLPAPHFRGHSQGCAQARERRAHLGQAASAPHGSGGVRNRAPAGKISCSDTNATAGMLAKITDGNKEAVDTSIVSLRKGVQYVQFAPPGAGRFAVGIGRVRYAEDLSLRGGPGGRRRGVHRQRPHALQQRHPREQGGPGAGTDREYFETNEGKLIDAKGAKGRYAPGRIRAGSSDSALNEYTEVEIYGRPSPMSRAALPALLLALNTPGRAGPAVPGSGLAAHAQRRGDQRTKNSAPSSSAAFTATTPGASRPRAGVFHAGLGQAHGSLDFSRLTEARLRLLTVLFGVGLILLLPLVADGLGREAAIAAGVLTAISPAMVFYSRY